MLDLASGNPLPEAIDRTSNSVVAWRPDNRSFFYLRYSKPTPQTPPGLVEYNGRTYLHLLGTDARGDGDAVVFGRGVSSALDVPDGQGTYIVLSPDSDFAVAIANHNMDNNPSTVYVAPLAKKVTDSSTPWQKVASVEDGICDFKLRGDQLYLLSQGGAPHFQVLDVPLRHPDLKSARVTVPCRVKPSSPASPIANDGLYLRERSGVRSQLLRVSLDGQRKQTIALSPDLNPLDPITGIR